MIWISTIFLLVVAAWLFFNALNERRWVEAHIHDETVASDEGILPSFSSRTSTANAGGAKLSIDQENSSFARAVQRVKASTDAYGERFFESKVAETKQLEGEGRPGSAAEENTLFGRSVARVKARGSQVDAWIDNKVQQTKSMNAPIASKISDTGNVIENAAKKVAIRSEQVASNVAERVKSAKESFDNARYEDADNGTFGKVVNKVSQQISLMDEKTTQKLADIRKSNGRVAKVEKSTKDMIARVSEKVGSQVNQVGNKIARQSRAKASSDNPSSTDD